MKPMPLFKRIARLFRRKRDPREMPPEVRKHVKLLQHSDPNVREHAAQELGWERNRHVSALPYLKEALQDPVSIVRWRSADALGKNRDPSAVPHLIKALQDPESDVRGEAVWALGEIRHASAIPHLANALRDKNSRVSSAAAEALGKIGNSLQGKTVEGREAKALQLVGQYFNKPEYLGVIRKAYLAALEGKVTPENARLFVKQLRALKGNVK